MAPLKTPIVAKKAQDTGTHPTLTNNRFDLLSFEKITSSEFFRPSQKAGLGQAQVIEEE